MASLPRLHPDVLWAEFDAAYVAYDPRVDQVHWVTGVQAVVANACQCGLAAADLCREIEAVAAVPAAQAATVVDDGLAALAAVGLLEGTAAPAPPCLGCGPGATAPSRRRVARRRRPR